MPTRCKKNRAAVASSKSWDRAKILVDLADCGNATLARSFIAENKEEFEPVLDGRIDKRNVKIRNIISNYKRWVNTAY